MDAFIHKRQEEWKQSFSKKVKDSKNIHKAIEQIIAEYIYYSNRIEQVKTRSKRIIKAMEIQMKCIPNTRKDIDVNELNVIKKNLQQLKAKLWT